MLSETMNSIKSSHYILWVGLRVDQQPACADRATVTDSDSDKRVRLIDEDTSNARQL